MERGALREITDHEWVGLLSGTGQRHEDAVARLHAQLLRTARFEIIRRGHGGWSGDLDDLATQAADDALMGIMRKLHTYRGESRFTNL